MAVALPAISVTSPSSIPSAVDIPNRRSATVKLRCSGFHGVVDTEQHSHDSESTGITSTSDIKTSLGVCGVAFRTLILRKFFKDRHYLEKDWGHYFGDGKIILEAGCGAGNTIFPLAKKYPQLYIHACDFSDHAITLVKSHPKFHKDQINVFACNIAEDNLCDHITPASVDIVTLIFTLSSVSPKKMPVVIQNLGRVLKPNGHILVRDYAIGDYAQAMLMNKNQIISENFYFRGDGTSSFYFSEDLLSNLFVRTGFTIVDVNTYNREIKNRARNISMQRRWIRAVFRRQP